MTRDYTAMPEDALRASQQEVRRDVGHGWMRLGVCPEPQTTAQTFRYHLGHGLVMGYPVLRVLAFAWRGRHAFRTSLGDPGEQQLREAWVEGYDFARGDEAADTLVLDNAPERGKRITGP